MGNSIMSRSKKTQSAAPLHESEKRFEKTFRSSPCAHCLSRLSDGQLIDVNDTWLHYTGYSREELLGRTSIDIGMWVDPGERPKFAQIIKARGSLRNHESLYLTRYGEKRVGIFTAEILEVAGEDQVLVSFIDITDRKRAEERVKLSERKFREIFELSPSALMISRTSDRVIVDVNKRLSLLVGIERPVIVGKQLYETGIRIDEAVRDDLRRKAMSSDGLHEEQFSCTLPGGKFFVGLVSATHTILDGEPHIIWSFLDATERFKAEQEKENLNEQLRRAERLEAIGTLASGIAHDFNNVLAAIIGYSDIGRRKSGRGETIQHELDTIDNAANRGRSLVQRILSFSRSEPARIAPVSLKAVIDDSLELLRPTIPRTILISCILMEDPSPVLMDPVQAQQVVMNLVANAVHAIGDKNGKIVISLSEARVHENSAFQLGTLSSGSAVCLEVADDGCGLDAESIGKVFDPFFTTKIAGHGTGLGLWTVGQAILHAGGAIKVESKLSSGATFRIFLPTGDRLALRNPSTALSSRNGFSPEQSRSPKGEILVVDDEPVLVQFAKLALESEGYRVDPYTSAPDALKAFRNDPQRYQLIMTDSSMPGISGTKLIESVRCLRPTLPIVLSSGHFYCADSSQGVDRYLIQLPKPFNLRTLLQTINGILCAEYENEVVSKTPSQIVSEAPETLRGN